MSNAQFLAVASLGQHSVWPMRVAMDSIAEWVWSIRTSLGVALERFAPQAHLVLDPLIAVPRNGSTANQILTGDGWRGAPKIHSNR